MNTFLIIPTGLQRIWLRRYQMSDDMKACRVHGYHNAMTLVGDAPEKKTPEGYIDSISEQVYADDPRWPARCDCGKEFGPMEPFQVFTRSLYRKQTGVEMFTIEDAPVGSIWNAWWLKCNELCGPDGQRLMCKLPGGHDWMIDGRANNCDSLCKSCGSAYHTHNKDGACKRFVESHPHKCWVRTGTAGQADFTVGKGKPGESCGAGAGSIIVPGWHGFLTGGMLKQC
jgi:hypothetical protein